MEVQLSADSSLSELDTPLHADVCVQRDSLPALYHESVVLAVDLCVKDNLTWCSVMHFNGGAFAAPGGHFVVLEVARVWICGSRPPVAVLRA